MSDSSRRAFLKSSAAIPFCLWMEKYVHAEPERRRIRYNVMSPRGQAMLAKYKDAVGKMMQKGTADPRSWNFQWYTHWVPPDFNPQTKINMIANIYNSPPAPPPPPPAAWKALAQDMWDTCQAHGPNEDENYFLPWHRMFVYWLERIVRKEIKDPEFTLPYWNYSASNKPSGPRLPPSFLMPNNPSTNPLWRSNRNSGSNAGDPIDKGQPDTPLGTGALNECTYEPNGAKQGFCMGLDFGLHGNVHVLTGNGQGMGNIPTAAGDPIFWMHHCNIDRLWASWNHGPNARPNPTDAGWLNQPFTFADENGTKVVVKVSEVDSITKLHYEYEEYEPLTRCPAPRKALNLESIQPLMTMSTGPVTLGSGPVRVQLKGEERTNLLQHFGALKAEEQIFVVLRDLSADSQPGVLYHVYLNVPEGGKPELPQDRYIGAVNFFGSMHEGHDGGPTTRFVSFEISRVLAKLKAGGMSAETATSVTIVPSGEPSAEAKPIIGQIAILKQ
jgi:tyrosinase